MKGEQKKRQGQNRLKENIKRMQEKSRKIKEPMRPKPETGKTKEGRSRPGWPAGENVTGTSKDIKEKAARFGRQIQQLRDDAMQTLGRN